LLKLQIRERHASLSLLNVSRLRGLRAAPPVACSSRLQLRRLTGPVRMRAVPLHDVIAAHAPPPPANASIKQRLR